MSTETLLAILCPEFGARDYEQIQRWRREHDAALADHILPHFTLIGPVSGWTLSDFASEVEVRLLGQTPFDIVLGGAVSNGGADEWLVPSVGGEAVAALREQLGSGKLSVEAGAGSPHITIGRDMDADLAEAHARAINEAGLKMRCRAGGVEIVSRKGDHWRTRERIPLGREA